MEGTGLLLEPWEGAGILLEPSEVAGVLLEPLEGICFLGKSQHYTIDGSNDPGLASLKYIRGLPTKERLPQKRTHKFMHDGNFR